MSTAPVFKRATKHAARARIGLVGPAGSGKTWTALTIARELGARVALIDTERGSASKYADLFEFDVLELEPPFSPERYVAAIRAAETAGYEALVIDSISHAWAGPGGVLEMVDNAAARARNNSYAGWKEGTPAQNALVDAMLRSRCHLVATMRSKVAYVQEKDERDRTVIRKIGMQPIQREGMDFEFDVVGDLDQEHSLVVSKSRCPAVADAVVKRPGVEFARLIKDWLEDGAPAPAEPIEAVPTEAAQQGGGTSPASAPASSGGGGTPAPPEPGPQPVDWQVRLLTEASLPDNPLTRAGSNGVLRALGIRVYNELSDGMRMRSAVKALRERFPDRLSALYARVEVPIASRSKPGHEHLVVLSRAGAEAKAECPCEGFRFSHACRHVPMAWSSLAFSWLTNETPSPREAWEGIDVDALAGVARAADEELEPQGTLPTGGPAEEEPAAEEKQPRVCVVCGEPWNGIGSRCEECLDVPAPKTTAGSAA